MATVGVKGLSRKHTASGQSNNRNISNRERLRVWRRHDVYLREGSKCQRWHPGTTHWVSDAAAPVTCVWTLACPTHPPTPAARDSHEASFVCVPWSQTASWESSCRPAVSQVCCPRSRQPDTCSRRRTRPSECSPTATKHHTHTTPVISLPTKDVYIIFWIKHWNKCK